MTTTQQEQTSWMLEVKIDQETGDGILEFPPEILQRVGWTQGEVLIWTDRGDGTWTLEKKE